MSWPMLSRAAGVSALLWAVILWAVVGCAPAGRPLVPCGTDAECADLNPQIDPAHALDPQ